MIQQVILGDCLVEMEKITDKSIDMVLADLPFGTTQNKWDSIIDLTKLWTQYKRIIKNNGVICLFAQTPFDKVLGNSNLEWLKYEWIWEKNKATGHLNSKKCPMKAHENILIFYNNSPIYNPQMGNGKAYSNSHKPGDSGTNYGKVKYSSVSNVTTRFPRSVLRFNVDIKAEFHPTQKPIELCEYLIKTYSNEGDIILDNCAGSGSTLLAAKNLNRQFIGIEKDPSYYDIILKRLT